MESIIKELESNRLVDEHIWDTIDRFFFSVQSSVGVYITSFDFSKGVMTMRVVMSSTDK